MCGSPSLLAAEVLWDLVGRCRVGLGRSAILREGFGQRFAGLADQFLHEGLLGLAEDLASNVASGTDRRRCE